MPVESCGEIVLDVKRASEGWVQNVNTYLCVRIFASVEMLHMLVCLYACI